MKITKFREVKGLVLSYTREDINEINQLKENKNIHIYGLRHSDNDCMGNSPATIEKQMVKVNNFGIFVTPSQINFEENDYLSLNTSEKISFSKSKCKKYTVTEIVETINKIVNETTK